MIQIFFSINSFHTNLRHRFVVMQQHILDLKINI